MPHRLAVGDQEAVLHAQAPERVVRRAPREGGEIDGHEALGLVDDALDGEPIDPGRIEGMALVRRSPKYCASSPDSVPLVAMVSQPSPKPLIDRLDD